MNINTTKFPMLVLCLFMTSITCSAFTRGPIRYQKVDVPLITALFEEREAIVYGPEREITGDIEIPQNVSTTLTNWKVTSIREYAFQNCKLTGLKLAPALRTIGRYAFHDCTNLKKVETSRGLKFIENSAFLNCRSLVTFIFAESLKLIDENVFRDCQSLQEAIFYDELTSIRQFAFNGCRSLKKVEFNHTPLTEISDGCFGFCSSLTEIKIPESVRRIGQNAFSYSGLETIYIGSRIKIIDYGAFTDTNLKDIFINCTTPPQCQGYMVNYGRESTITIHVPNGCKEAYMQHHYFRLFNIVDDFQVYT